MDIPESLPEWRWRSMLNLSMNDYFSSINLDRSSWAAERHNVGCCVDKLENHYKIVMTYKGVEFSNILIDGEGYTLEYIKEY